MEQAQANAKQAAAANKKRAAEFAKISKSDVEAITARSALHSMFSSCLNEEVGVVSTLDDFDEIVRQLQIRLKTAEEPNDLACTADSVVAKGMISLYKSMLLHCQKLRSLLQVEIEHEAAASRQQRKASAVAATIPDLESRCYLDEEEQDIVDELGDATKLVERLEEGISTMQCDIAMSACQQASTSALSRSRKGTTNTKRASTKTEHQLLKKAKKDEAGTLPAAGAICDDINKLNPNGGHSLEVGPDGFIVCKCCSHTFAQTIKDTIKTHWFL